jgi:disulfide bond formation protein DsbB
MFGVFGSVAALGSEGGAEGLALLGGLLNLNIDAAGTAAVFLGVIGAALHAAAHGVTQEQPFLFSIISKPPDWIPAKRTPVTGF